MAYFHLHFFKEKSRKIDIDALISFFENFEEIEVQMDETSARFIYTHPRLGFEATFIITPKSVVPNIYRLNPRFLDLNFRLDIPLFYADYVVEEILKLVKKLVTAFNFYVYSEAFEDVLSFKSETILKAYILVKEAYISKYPQKIDTYYKVSKEKLSNILRYLDDLLELQIYYKDLRTYVPKYVFYVTNTKEVISLIEWKEDSLTVFPPEVDYILLRQGQRFKVIQYHQFLENASKLLLDVPGFLKGTKVITKKNAKKIFKLAKNKKKTPGLELDLQQLKNITYHQLID